MTTLLGQILGIRGNYENDRKKMLVQITKSRKKHHGLGSVRFEIITFISSFILYTKPLDRKIKPGSRGGKILLTCLLHSNYQCQEILEQCLKIEAGTQQDFLKTIRLGL